MFEDHDDPRKAYDNFEYASKWIDPGFKAAGTVSSIVGGFLIKLGESGRSLRTCSKVCFAENRNSLISRVFY